MDQLILPGMPDNILPPTPEIIRPPTFDLSKVNKEALNKLRDEIMDKIHTSENSMTSFYSAYEEHISSWRIQPMRRNANRPKGFSNDKSGETHRATETLATLWVRMLTADDPYFALYPEGLGPNGMPITEEDLYAMESLIAKQLSLFLFKQELYRGLNSTGLFGSVIFENSWEQIMAPGGGITMEGTKLRMRPLISTFVDFSCEDFGDSDFIATVDYPSLYRIKQWIRQNPGDWDANAINFEPSYTKYLADGKNSNTRNRIIERKQRAGYAEVDKHIREIINYHGRLDANNEVIQQYWESMGYQEDPSDFDFSLGVMDSMNVAKLHVAPYGNWRNKFQWAHYKQIEVEPLGYGVGSLGRVKQRELDLVGSRSNDILYFALNNMWAINRFANIKQEQLTINPNNIIEVDGDPRERINPLRPDVQAIVQALAMMAISREEFRTNTGAASQLQAILTKATATESSLTQTEAIRAASVHAELISESFLRRFLQQCHVNNYFLLNSDVWLYVTGTKKPRLINNGMIPYNVGVKLKLTTDKDFRPERIQKILEGLQIATSMRSIIPETINIVRPLVEEYFRSIGLNPGLLHQPVPMKDMLSTMLQRNMLLRPGQGGNGSSVANETSSEVTGGLPSSVSTPVGDVPTSPISNPGGEM